MTKFKKRFLALACAAAVAVAGLPLAPAKVAEAKVLDGLTNVARQVVAEGCVLIKNDNAVLPLEGGEKISVFGRAQCNYYKSGTGSGGDVKVPYTTGILEGLRKNPKVQVNEELADIYTDWVKSHPFDNGGGGWAAEPWFQEEMPLTEEQVEAAKAKSDTAVVLIGRTAGEDKDSAVAAGSYLLTEKEKDMLAKVTTAFDKVAVVLNVPAIMDMLWMDDYDIDSVVYVWQGGMSGGDGAADVLTGDVNPSGRLTDTIAKNYEDYPSSKNFGRTDYNYYVEDIYVGYRYFETFAPDKVLYPFGYGLSYTTFDTSAYSVTETEDSINVFTTVENTGDRAGKETVQVYFGAPQGKLGRPAKELVAFAKTKLLEPGESQDITLTFKKDNMKTYDDSGVTGHKSAYVLEAGDYNIYVGNDVRGSKLAYVYNQKQLKVVEQLEEEMAPVKAFQRIKPVVTDDDGVAVTAVGYEDVPLQTVDVPKKILDNQPQELVKKDDQHYDLKDVADGKLTIEQFVAQLSWSELVSIVQGEGMSPSGVTPGVASAFGGVNTKQEDGTVTTLTELYGIPRACTADGPSGIRQTANATSIPGGAAIACTWNLDLIEKMMILEGQEMVENEIDSLLGPGINIHRNPLNGRNFEYYSEDPLVTGRVAAAYTKGIQKSGATVTIKHFCANNQETNRHYDDSRVSERALREIYLRGFEIAVKEGHARSVMTSYNPVNGLWTASNYDLATDILRKEWGFEGIVMTDWWARMNKNIGDASTTSSGVQYINSMVKSQNDLYKVTPDASTDSAANVGTKIVTDGLTIAELQRSAVNICNFLLKSQAFARLTGREFEPYSTSGDEWFTIEKSEFGDPRLTAIMVDGREISTFDEYVFEYNVYTPAQIEQMPTVSGVAFGQGEVTVEQATADNRVAKIHVKENGEETIYRVIFSAKEGLPPVFDNPVYAELEDIRVNGETMEGFTPEVYEYAIPVESITSEPVITWTASEEVKVSKAWDNELKMATITCATTDQVKYYRIRFGVRPQNDEFNDNSLNDTIWTVENENADNWSIGNGHLTINSEYGSIYQDQSDDPKTNARNMFVQPAYGDWEVVTKLDLDKLPWTNYQSVGIAVKQDDDNYINLKTEWSGKLAISLTQEANAKINILEELPASDLEKFSDTVYFKLKKIGNTYTAAVSPDGENYISFSASASGEYSDPKFALVCCNGSVEDTDSLAANFDYVKFNTDVAASVLNIGDDTKLKVAETEPVAISSGLRPTACKDEDGGKNFTNCNKGEYVTYHVNVDKTGIYDFTARMASAASETAQIKAIVYVDGEEATSFVTSGTGGAQEWVTSQVNKAKLTAGEHKLKVYFDMAGMELNWIHMKLASELSDTALNNAIKAAQAKDISTYPAARQEAFRSALEAAKEAAASATSQGELDAALKTLQDAEQNLEVKTSVTSIKLDAKEISLIPGSSVTLNAAAVPAEHTDTLVWSSSNEKAATVKDGVVTAVAEGSSVITVSAGSVTAACTVTVEKYNQDISTPPAASNQGAINQVNVTCSKSLLYTGGNTGNAAKISVTVPQGAEIKSVDYGTSNAKAAAINIAGEITAAKAGKAAITAKVELTNGESKLFTFDVTVKKAYIQKVKVPASVKKGKSVNLKAKAYGSSAKITWSLKKSSKVAKLTKAGKFTAKKKGSVTVVATSGKIKKTFKIKVK
ncbi:glycoside hydrolase family 3 C-terminal domain-containing protein [Lachnospiraceae bacterium 45-W7]